MSNIETIKQQHIAEVNDPEHSKRQISIWLDSYDDIFSDFDPRPYSDRILSDDFISELKKVCREDTFEIGELRLLIPVKEHKPDNEQIIIKRLHAYFRRSNYFLSRQLKRIRRQAVLIALAGMILILAASYISAIESHGFLLKALVVLFEPAGWFFTWTGMDDLFFSSRRKRRESDFYSKIVRSKIAFATF